MTADPTGANNVVAAGANAHGVRSLTAKAADEFRRFLLLFFYLWILFGVFVLNQGVVLREHGINFAMQGFAFFNALVFAKVMMLFEVFDPGRWLRKRPLIYPILYESLLLTVLFLIAHVLEKTIEGLIRGKTLTESMPVLTGAGLPGFLSITVILFIALLPFFGLRNLSLAMGEGRLYGMIFEKPSAQDGERRSGAAS
ncbi:MAG TPA: hypothetical protein VI256_13685 [Roseiarcus sp.]|jgi:hypothetical protein